MGEEPGVKRAVAFVDGQNLHHCARNAFGFTRPSYDAIALARTVCSRRGWESTQVRFYTGVPAPHDDRYWNRYWTAKLADMARRGAFVYAGSLRRRRVWLRLPDGGVVERIALEEKGIDVRIGVDLVDLAHRRAYDVALIFSQDQDLSEAAVVVRAIAADQGRWVKLASAYPHSARTRKGRGIDGTEWLRIDRATYEACLDRRDLGMRP